MTGYAFGPFVKPLEQEFGWSRSEVNVGLSLTFIAGLVAPLSGRLIDRFGARPVMVGSLALIALGFGLRPLIHELWQFYLFSGLVYLGMPGASILSAGRLVGMWFPRTRGRMMGLVTAGNNFGGLTIVPLATVVIAVASWEWGYVTFGLMASILVVAILVVVRERPRASVMPTRDAAGRQASDRVGGLTVRQALRSQAFYLVTFGITAGAFTYSVILTQLIPHLENEGLGEGAAAAALTVMAAFGLTSKLLFGRFSETVTARRAFVLSLSIQATGLVLFIAAGGSTLVWLAVVVFGLGFGGMGALIPLTVSEMFGLKAFGSILGLVTFVGILPQLVGPIAAGITFDTVGNYQPVFFGIVGLYIAGATALFLARPPHTQVKEAPGSAR